MRHFIQNDLRGEYWLYSEGNMKVNVGRGGFSGVCHFNTSDVHLESGGPLDNRKVAEILAQSMIEFGNERNGYKKIVLHNDGKYDLASEHIALIDHSLSKLGFRMLNNPNSAEILWSKGTYWTTIFQFFRRIRG